MAVCEEKARGKCVGKKKKEHEGSAAGAGAGAPIHLFPSRWRNDLCVATLATTVPVQSYGFIPSSFFLPLFLINYNLLLF